MGVFTIESLLSDKRCVVNAVKSDSNSGVRARSITDANSTEKTKQSEHFKQPQNNCDYHHNVQDLLDFTIHRDVSVDESQ